MISNLQIKEQIEAAFDPFKCVAVIWDYERKINFRVIDQNNNVLAQVENVVLDDVRRPETLLMVIEGARAMAKENAKLRPKK